MEDFVARLLGNSLDKYISNFSRDKVSDFSMMRGRGTLSNLEVNCDEVNKSLDPYSVPLVFSKIHINKIAFKYSITKLRRKPVKAMIDKIEIDMIPRKCYVNNERNGNGKRKTDTEFPSLSSTVSQQSNLSDKQKQYTEEDINGDVEKTVSSSTATNIDPNLYKYNRSTRIVDGLSISINQIIFRINPTMTTKYTGNVYSEGIVGILELKKVNIFTTDEMGQKADDLEKCWSMNLNRKFDYITYRKILIKEMTFKLITSSLNDTSYQSKDEMENGKLNGKGSIETNKSKNNLLSGHDKEQAVLEEEMGINLNGKSNREKYYLHSCTLIPTCSIEIMITQSKYNY